jgi:hypothetical protein
MVEANVPLEVRYLVYHKAFETATLLDGLTTVTIDGVTKTRYEHWGGAIPGFARHLRTWGEAGTVKIKSLETPKVADRGVQCMMVGYALKHAPDCYQMLNIETKRVMETRDVIWLRRMFYEKKPKVNDVVIEPEIEEVEDGRAGEGIQVDDDEDDTADVPMTEEAVDGNIDQAPAEDDEDDEVAPILQANTTRSGRVVNAPRRLIEEYNAMVVNYEIKLTDAETKYYQAIKNTEFGMVGAGIGGGFVNTTELHVMKYDEAMKKTRP